MTEKRTSSARARSGFTLAELLIVTGIVAILVAVSIPIMSGQVQKAKEVRAKAEARILCMALWMYLHDLDEQDIHPESWELMMDLGGSFRELGENPLENYLDDIEGKCVNTQGRQGHIDALSVKLVDQEIDDSLQLRVITGAQRTQRNFLMSGAL